MRCALPICLLLAFAVQAGAAERPDEATPQQVEFFEKNVRPILAEHCWKCHGDKKQKGRLRLDSRSAVLKGGELGPVVVAGEPDRSLLVEAINYSLSDIRMPPNGKLPQEHIDALTKWVEMGVPWPAEQKAGATNPDGSADLQQRSEHWSFQPIERPSVPDVERTGWPRNGIDRFILARLEERGLAPAARADKRTLLRRVYFDLIGLPPTSAEIQAFLNDKSPDTYGKVVDRLLASPHYGERWARHWLDLVRYAGTAGHEFDYEIPHAWRYRDYVIRAFNGDVPYDRFVTEHVAGDLLPEPRRNPDTGINESIIGTGFWWFGQGKHSPVDLRAEECDRMDNQLDVFGKAFLGLTIACARCHDHKFDPISMRDYYALAGYLQSTRRQRAIIDDPAETEAVVHELKALKSRIRESVNRALAGDDRQSDRFAEAAPIPTSSAHTLFEDFTNTTWNGWFVSGPAFGSGPTRGGEIALPLHAGDSPQAIQLAGPNLAHSGLVSGRLQGTLRSRTFEITQPYIYYRVARFGGPDSPGRQLKNGQIHLIVDGFQFIKNPLYGHFSINVKNDGTFRWYRQDVREFLGKNVWIEIQDSDDGFLVVDRIVFSDGEPPPEQLPGPVTQLRLADSAVTSADALGELIDKYRAVESGIQPPRRAIAAADGTGENEHILIRGNHEKPGPKVPRRFLEVFVGGKADPPERGSGRLGLARKMVDPETNPLLARVMVNRLWQHHFGRGIVSTPDNFGVQGKPPTHPKLLDWLASEFIRRDWSIKDMHRMMVLSSTYRMSSALNSAHAERADPQNKLLHRMPVRRLEAEIIRDAILSVSGEFDPQMYGPGILPHLTPFMQGRGRPSRSGPLDGNGRRSIYINVRRNFLTPLFLAFDYPTPYTTIGQRSVSNVPAQALILMNNPFVVQQARRWAERVLADPDGSPEQRIREMYETAYGRPPTDEETAAALQFLDEQGEVYNGTADVRTWADLCHVLMNAKEFLFVK